MSAKKAKLSGRHGTEKSTGDREGKYRESENAGWTACAGVIAYEKMQKQKKGSVVRGQTMVRMWVKEKGYSCAQEGQQVKKKARCEGVTLAVAAESPSSSSDPGYRT